MSKTIRHIRIEGNSAFVPLTRGYTAALHADVMSGVIAT